MEPKPKPCVLTIRMGADLYKVFKWVSHNQWKSMNALAIELLEKEVRRIVEENQ